jgi:hypothetical protein
MREETKSVSVDADDRQSTAFSLYSHTKLGHHLTSVKHDDSLTSGLMSYDS